MVFNAAKKPHAKPIPYVHNVNKNNAPSLLLLGTRSVGRWLFAMSDYRAFDPLQCRERDREREAARPGNKIILVLIFTILIITLTIIAIVTIIVINLSLRRRTALHTL